MSFPEPKPREFLGDGVYARRDEGVTRLTAESGAIIYHDFLLTDEVLVALLDYLDLEFKERER